MVISISGASRNLAQKLVVVHDAAAVGGTALRAGRRSDGGGTHGAQRPLAVLASVRGTRRRRCILPPLGIPLQATTTVQIFRSDY